MDHHLLLRKLRKERHVSQSQLSQGICSRTTLSSFENTGTNISLKLFLKFLERLNITLEDYFIYYSHNKGEEPLKKQFTETIMKAYYGRNYQEVLRLTQKATELYQETNDFFYFCQSLQYQLVLNRENSLEIFSEEIDSLKAYLNDVEVWGQFEIKLVTSCLHLFDEDYLLLKAKTLASKYKAHKGSVNYYKVYSSFILNALFLHFERQELETVPYYLTVLKSFTTVNYMKERLLFQYFSGLLVSLTRSEEEGATLSNGAIAIFYQLEFEEYGNQLALFQQKVVATKESD